MTRDEFINRLENTQHYKIDRATDDKLIIIVKHKFITYYKSCFSIPIEIICYLDYFKFDCSLFNSLYQYTEKNLNLIIELTVNKLDEYKDKL